MVKKALVVGLNYPDQKHQLYGCVNDTLNWVAVLEKQFKFEEVRVLIDQNPNGSFTTYPTQIPTKHNILSQFGWLVSGVQQGDTLAFVFAGHGCQVFSGSEHADEALVPEDFQKKDEQGNPTLVFDDELHALLKRLPTGTFMTCIFDCCHATHMLDVPTCVDGGKARQSRNRPMQVTKRFEPSWQKNEHAFARPRFIEAVHWRGPRHRRTEEGSGQHVGRMNLDPAVTAFSFAACSTHEVALDANIKAQQQGLMSFCLQQALTSLNHRCTYERWLEKASEIADDIRSKYMPTMDQHIHLSYCPSGPPSEVVVLDERYATVSQHRLSQGQGQPNDMRASQSKGRSESSENLRHDRQQRAAQEQQLAAPRQVSSDFIPMPQYNMPANAQAPPPYQGQPPLRPQNRTEPSSPLPTGGRAIATHQEPSSPLGQRRTSQEALSPRPSVGAGAPGIDLSAFGMGPIPTGNLPAPGSFSQPPPSGVAGMSPLGDAGGGSPMTERSNIFGMPNLFSGIGDLRGPSSVAAGGLGLGNLFSSGVQAPTTNSPFSSQQPAAFASQQPSAFTSQQPVPFASQQPGAANAFASSAASAFSSQQQAAFSSVTAGGLQAGPSRTPSGFGNSLASTLGIGGYAGRSASTPHINAYASGASNAFASGTASGAMAAYQQAQQGYTAAAMNSSSSAFQQMRFY
jgi:hypothetical protein